MNTVYRNFILEKNATTKRMKLYDLGFAKSVKCEISAEEAKEQVLQQISF